MHGISGRAGDGADDETVRTAVDLTWDKATVSLEALERALYALADTTTGSIRDDGTRWSTGLVIQHPASRDTQEAIDRLHREVIDQSLRIKIAERTDPLRNLVFAAAFSRSGLVDGKTGA